MKKTLKWAIWAPFGLIAALIFFSSDKPMQMVFLVLGGGWWGLLIILDKIDKNDENLRYRLSEIERKLDSLSAHQPAPWVQDGLADFVAERDRQKREAHDAEMDKLMSVFRDGGANGK